MHASGGCVRACKVTASPCQCGSHTLRAWVVWICRSRSRAFNIVEMAAARTTIHRREERRALAIQRQEAFDLVRTIRRAAASSAAASNHLIMQTEARAKQWDTERLQLTDGNATVSPETAGGSVGSDSGGDADAASEGKGAEGGAGTDTAASVAATAVAVSSVSHPDVEAVPGEPTEAVAVAVAAPSPPPPPRPPSPPQPKSVHTVGVQVTPPPDAGLEGFGPLSTAGSATLANTASSAMAPRLLHFRAHQRSQGLRPSPVKHADDEERKQARAAAEERRWMEVEDRRSYALIHAKWLRDQYVCVRVCCMVV